ncbi:unnamed protein product [Cyprideis torosa]|uniref:Uncharacterized protein n=1 Tax=Cyprideis torosa TaxID=163714 RepID=A0A7R8ZKL3_9CRUS|nr:unnamed protein product [Cyprideis torosa]CAG0880480.1 unnamed protein product [Cyprideis torosa]
MLQFLPDVDVPPEDPKPKRTEDFIFKKPTQRPPSRRSSKKHPVSACVMPYRSRHKASTSRVPSVSVLAASTSGLVWSISGVKRTPFLITSSTSDSKSRPTPEIYGHTPGPSKSAGESSKSEPQPSTSQQTDCGISEEEKEMLRNIPDEDVPPVGMDPFPKPSSVATKCSSPSDLLYLELLHELPDEDSSPKCCSPMPKKKKKLPDLIRIPRLGSAGEHDLNDDDSDHLAQMFVDGYESGSEVDKYVKNSEYYWRRVVNGTPSGISQEMSPPHRSPEVSPHSTVSSPTLDSPTSPTLPKFTDFSRKVEDYFRSQFSSPSDQRSGESLGRRKSDESAGRSFKDLYFHGRRREVLADKKAPGRKNRNVTTTSRHVVIFPHSIPQHPLSDNQTIRDLYPCNVILLNGVNVFLLNPRPIKSESPTADREETGSAVITELATLANAAGSTSAFAACKEKAEVTRKRAGDGGTELLDDMRSSSLGTSPSKSPMADLEDGACDVELAEMASAAGAAGSHGGGINPQFAAALYHHQLQHQQHGLRAMKLHPDPSGASRFHPHHLAMNSRPQVNITTVCQPGSTALWDLLSDEKIVQLGEGLALEAERALCNILCCPSTDRLIRLKFIQGCLSNIANNRNVVISLRILPRVLASFQQMNPKEGEQMIMLAETDHNMLQIVFKNLKDYTSKAYRPLETLYTPQQEIQVRLHFLSAIFSLVDSDALRLTTDHVDILWSCLIDNPVFADELFEWILNQAKNRDQAAMFLQTAVRKKSLLFNSRHLIISKLANLEPERISVLGLALLWELISMCRIAMSSKKLDEKRHQSAMQAIHRGMTQLWNVALKAKSHNVSNSAIQFLNTYYISAQSNSLELEPGFIDRCLEQLVEASNRLQVDQEGALLILQRGITLLRSHLECVQKRIYAQIFQEKIPIETNTFQLLGELRAELYIAFRERQKAKAAKTATVHPTVRGAPSTRDSPVLGSLLLSNPPGTPSTSTASAPPPTPPPAPTPTPVTPEGEGRELLRLHCGGQEIHPDLDDKTLGELGMKDHQVLTVSLSLTRPPKRTGLATSEVPNKENLPMNLLLEPAAQEKLFSLLQKLSTLRCSDGKGGLIPNSKAQVLSRRVWEILMMIPGSPAVLADFRSLSPLHPSLPNLMDPESIHKLYYSLYVVQSLGRTGLRKLGETSDLSAEAVEQKKKEAWTTSFIECGGLRHIFDIFLSGALQPPSGGKSPWDDWKQDCLAMLLKLLCEFGLCLSDLEVGELAVQELFESDDKRGKGKSGSAKLQDVTYVLPSLFNIKDSTAVLERLLSILDDSSYPLPSTAYPSLIGRALLIRYDLTMLLLWTSSTSDGHQLLISILSRSPGISPCIKRILLECPNGHVRRETVAGLLRLCFASKEENAGKGVAALINLLRPILPVAATMKPFVVPALQHSGEEHSPKERDHFGPTARDYFQLFTQLMEKLGRAEAVDIDGLVRELEVALISRPIHEEQRKEDDVLIGALQLTYAAFKHNPPYKTNNPELLNKLLDFVFSLPSPSDRSPPKCKSSKARAACFDILMEVAKDSVENYSHLLDYLMLQHKPGVHEVFPWEYWPQDELRSECGYVGLNNLGATCYLNTCMQHLYMMPKVREVIFSVEVTEATKHEATLREIRRMFTFLQLKLSREHRCPQESERKSYNPKSFCKVYQMDHQPLNTGDQKDMTEFFIDLVCKMEEMDPDLKHTMKDLFAGTMVSSVISLDCPHVSQTAQEFYTIRCQVADMRSLQESLDEITVKDTLEGDNMYTCDQCSRKVRAEKRSCYRRLPQIMCFNTMRYSFNMITQTREKVNTHFSFPMTLDMAPYMEETLMPSSQREQADKAETPMEQGEGDAEATPKAEGEGKDQDEGPYLYQLIGVTVHTGHADGGHYYSFIRVGDTGKWFLFNDAEVKAFDPSHLPIECFGGDMPPKGYEGPGEKYMDFSFEKANSAYMLFYERIPRMAEKAQCEATSSTSQEDNGGLPAASLSPGSQRPSPSPTVPKDLLEWIWNDNRSFLRDKNIFEVSYFSNFMYQLCNTYPGSMSNHPEVVLKATKLGVCFFLETFIHAKEKPLMVEWVQHITKQLAGSTVACDWLLDLMCNEDTWPVHILIKCPNPIIRQMYQRLVILVVSKLRAQQIAEYRIKRLDSDGNLVLGQGSSICRFARSLLILVTLVSMNQLDDAAPRVPLPMDKAAVCQAMEKLLSLVTVLVEIAMSNCGTPSPLAEMGINEKDENKEFFPFLNVQIREAIALKQSALMILYLTRANEPLAISIIVMLFQSTYKGHDYAIPYFKILTLLCDIQIGQPNVPHFVDLILQRLWTASSNQFILPVMEWLAQQVTRNKAIHTFILESMDTWVETFLLAHSNVRVRNATAYLLVSLLPDPNFRGTFRASRSAVATNRPGPGELTEETLNVLTDIYQFLLDLLHKAKKHLIEPGAHQKLTSYFSLLNFLCVSRREKLMFGPYFSQLWNLFHPTLSEPAIAVHPNKLALLTFWYNVCSDCPENIELIVNNPAVIKNIAFNYILADHESNEVIMFNRTMLPTYYGLLNMCCAYSPLMTRKLANHTNIQWAFKNIAPFPTQYTQAVDELFRLMRRFVACPAHATDEERAEIKHFKIATMELYLKTLDGKTQWATLIAAFSTLIESQEDRVYIVVHGGLKILFEAFNALQVMFYEATACHVHGELCDVINIIVSCIRAARAVQDSNVDIGPPLAAIPDRCDTIRKLAFLLNTYVPNTIRLAVIDLLREFTVLFPKDTIATLTPHMLSCHLAWRQGSARETSVNPHHVAMGPYFPRRGDTTGPTNPRHASRPSRPLFQMSLPPDSVDAPKGVDPEYDKALREWFYPYYQLIDIMCRVAINHGIMSQGLVSVNSMVGVEAAALHLPLFPKLWLDVHNAKNLDKRLCAMILSSEYLSEYMEAVLLEERPSLTNNIIFKFMCTFLPHIADRILNDRVETLFNNLCDMLMHKYKTATDDYFSSAANLLEWIVSVPLVPPLKRPRVEGEGTSMEGTEEGQSTEAGASAEAEPAEQSAPGNAGEDREPTANADEDASGSGLDDGGNESGASSPTCGRGNEKTLLLATINLVLASPHRQK